MGLRQPSSLTPAEIEELAALEAGDVEKPDPSTAGLSESEAAELALLEEQEKGIFGEVGDAAKTGLRGGVKALDFLGGATGRPLLAAALELATGKDVFKTKELEKAVDITTSDLFPSSDELFRRAGVPEGATFSQVFPSLFEGKGEGNILKPEKGGLLDVSVRGAGGFLADVLTDPLTFLSLGTSALGKKGAKQLAKKTKPLSAPQKALDTAGKFFLNPVSAPTTAGGKKLFKSGVSQASQAAEQVGKVDFTGTLLKHNIVGTATQIQKKAAAVASKLKTSRDEILERADDAIEELAFVSPETKVLFETDELFSSFRKQLDDLAENGLISKSEIPKIEEDLIGSFLGATKPLNPSLVTQWKTEVGKRVRNSARLTTKSNTTKDKIQLALEGSLRDAVERKVDDVLGKGVGTEQLALLNNDLGNLLTARQTFASAAKKSQNQKALTTLDVILGGGAFTFANPAFALQVLAAKKALELSRTTSFRTFVGGGLAKAGTGRLSAPLLDIAGRRAVTRQPDTGGAPPPPLLQQGGP